MSEQRQVTVYRWEADRPRCAHECRSTTYPAVIGPDAATMRCDLPAGHAGGHVATAFNGGYASTVTWPTTGPLEFYRP